jgi:hypothetical protein
MLIDDAVFMLSSITIFVGLCKYVISYALKSKCEDFRLCFGCINIHRNIAAEVELERAEIQAGLPQEPVVDV